MNDMRKNRHHKTLMEKREPDCNLQQHYYGFHTIQVSVHVVLAVYVLYEIYLIQ